MPSLDESKKMKLVEFLTLCVKNKPNELIISDLKWKFLLRAIVKGKNILLVGDTGCGKTFAAQTASKYIINNEMLYHNDEFYYFNLGSMQDPRSALIGNTTYDKSTGTVFNESSFIKAIRTKNSIILLDELSRANNDVFNILMTVLDELQRYIRLDEKTNGEIVRVAEGVTFIATANIGIEYTATRVIDKALSDRFPIIIEMLPLEEVDELNVLATKYNIKAPELLEELKKIIRIANHTRQQLKAEDAKLTRAISTRSVSEMAELLVDGFSLIEIAECAIYPLFDNSGGIDSERVYIQQLVQKELPSLNAPDNLFGSGGFIPHV